jgi:Enoyl-CoA hydratase/carnithine racemase
MSNLIQQAISPGLVRILLNRPEAFNSLSESLLDELQESLREISNNNDIRVVILAASGKAFAQDTTLKR